MRKKGLLGVFAVGVLAIVGFTLVQQWGEGAVVVLGPPGGAVRVSIDGRDQGTVQPGAWRRYAVRLGRHEVRVTDASGEASSRRTEAAANRSRSPGDAAEGDGRSRRSEATSRRAAASDARSRRGAAEPEPSRSVTHEVTLDSDFAHLGVPALKEQCFTELELTLKPDGTRTPKVVSRTRASAPWPIPTSDLLSEAALPRSVTEERRYTVLATVSCEAMASDAEVLASLGHALAAPPPPEPPKGPAAGGLTSAEVDAPPAAPPDTGAPREPGAEGLPRPGDAPAAGPPADGTPDAGAVALPPEPPPAPTGEPRAAPQESADAPPRRLEPPEPPASAGSVAAPPREASPAQSDAG